VQDHRPIHERLQLSPHPEGGYFREYYRGAESVETAAGKRSTATSIYFLLYQNDVSHLHRLVHDEIWYWHEGGDAVVHVITQAGEYRAMRVGPGGDYAVVVPAGCWFGASCSGSHVLLSAMVAPGFDFADFELADRQALLSSFPDHADIVNKLTEL